MKAWCVSDVLYNDCVVVFAKTIGQAKSIARYTDALENCEFVYLRARRLPKIDDLVDSPCEADWGDRKIRIALVREYGWRCVDPDWSDCNGCPAAKWCDCCAEKALEDEEEG